MILDHITMKAGNTWDKEFFLYCAKTGTKLLKDETQKQDIILHFLKPAQKVFVECKGTDLPKSMNKGKQKETQLEDEFNDSYLPHPTWLLIGGKYPYEHQLIQRVASLCFKLRVPWKFYDSPENAVAGLFKYLEDHYLPSDGKVDFGYATKYKIDDGNTTRVRRFMAIEGVSREKAVELDQKLTAAGMSSEYDMMATFDKFAEVLATVYPPNKDGTVTAFYVRLYNYFAGGQEPRPLNPKPPKVLEMPSGDDLLKEQIRRYLE